MFVRNLFGTRLVVVTGLAATIALAGCSSPAPSFEHPAASQGAGAAATSVAKTTPMATQQAAGIPLVAKIPPATSTLTVDCVAFDKQAKITANVHLVSGDVLYVTLCSNASTGFAWEEQPVATGDALSFTGVSTGMPESSATDAGASLPPVVGAASTTTFMLRAEHAGSATATFSYSRPWAGGEKGVWTYTIEVTIG